MAVKQLVRVFMYKGDELVDVNPTYAPETVMEHYAGTYPELLNATVSGPKIENNKAIYTFEKSLGTKG